MSDQTQDVDIARLQEQLKSLKDKQDVDHQALVSLQKDRDKALLWGIIVLGSTVLSLASWIMKYVFKVI